MRTSDALLECTLFPPSLGAPCVPQPLTAPRQRTARTSWASSAPRPPWLSTFIAQPSTVRPRPGPGRSCPRAGRVCWREGGRGEGGGGGRVGECERERESARHASSLMLEVTSLTLKVTSLAIKSRPWLPEPTLQRHIPRHEDHVPGG